MSPYSQLTEALAGLIALPFAVAGGLWRLWQRWRVVPLQQRNVIRASSGAFVLAGCAVVAANGFPVIGPKLTAGVAAVALLYLAIGIHGARGTPRFDSMSVVWTVLVILAAALLAFWLRDFRCDLD